MECEVIKLYTPEQILNILKSEHVEFEHINFNVLGGERPPGIKDEHIVKCLAVKGAYNVYIICIPINKRIDYRKFKRTFGEKKARLVEDVEHETGYPHGANGPIPISLTSDHIIYFDETLSNDFLVSNIGEYGNTVKMDAQTLATLVNARYSDFTVESGE